MLYLLKSVVLCRVRNSKKMHCDVEVSQSAEYSWTCHLQTRSLQLETPLWSGQAGRQAEQKDRRTQGVLLATKSEVFIGYQIVGLYFVSTIGVLLAINCQTYF